MTANRTPCAGKPFDRASAAALSAALRSDSPGSQPEPHLCPTCSTLVHKVWHVHVHREGHE